VALPMFVELRERRDAPFAAIHVSIRPHAHGQPKTPNLNPNPLALNLGLKTPNPRPRTSNPDSLVLGSYISNPKP